MPVIKCSQLTKIYDDSGNQNIVLDHINLQIKQSEFVMITGPSGSGKTTLLYLLSGLDEPTSGLVYLNGKNLSKLSQKETIHLRQNDLGFVFQSYNLIPTLNVYENVAMPLLLKNEKPDPKRINELLSLTGILDKAKSYPDHLSGGMQQRVSIARSLVHRPKVVFADEPTGNLDKEKSDSIMQLLKKINQELKTTIVLVSHDLSHKAYATRVLELANAKIVEDYKK